MPYLKRRAFITLLGGGAAALLDSRLPLEAQQANKIYRLGVLSPSSASVDSIRAVTVPELAKAGFVEGRTSSLTLAAELGRRYPSWRGRWLPATWMRSLPSPISQSRRQRRRRARFRSSCRSAPAIRYPPASRRVSRGPAETLPAS
jgi:hypothetical protein